MLTTTVTVSSALHGLLHPSGSLGAQMPKLAGAVVGVQAIGPGTFLQAKAARSAAVALGAGDPMRVGGRGWPAKLEIMEVMSRFFRTTQHADESK